MRVYEVYSFHTDGVRSGFVVFPNYWTWGCQVVAASLDNETPVTWLSITKLKGYPDDTFRLGDLRRVLTIYHHQTENLL